MKGVEADLGYLETGVGFHKTLLISRNPIELHHVVLKKEKNSQKDISILSLISLLTFMLCWHEWEVHNGVVRAPKNVFTFIHFPGC